jgi:hypothetical protein
MLHFNIRVIKTGERFMALATLNALPVGDHGEAR